jgi:hypothetical protein
MHLTYQLDEKELQRGTRQKIIGNALSAFGIDDRETELWPISRFRLWLAAGVKESPNSLLMLLGVKIDDFLDHCLVRNVVLTRFRLEELDAPLAQRQCDLHRAFFENELIRTWQEIRHNLRLSYGLSDSFRCPSVFYFAFHKHVCPLSNIPLRKSESCFRDK